MCLHPVTLVCQSYRSALPVAPNLHPSSPWHTSFPLMAPVSMQASSPLGNPPRGRTMSLTWVHPGAVAPAFNGLGTVCIMPMDGALALFTQPDSSVTLLPVPLAPSAKRHSLKFFLIQVISHLNAPKRD